MDFHIIQLYFMSSYVVLLSIYLFAIVAGYALLPGVSFPYALTDIHKTNVDKTNFI